MQLTVKNLQSETFTVDCDKDDTIKQLKEKIAAKNDLSQKYDPELLKLLYSGKVMDDEETVDSFQIKTDAYLVLVKQTPGKPKPPPKKKPNPYNNFGGGFGTNGFMQNPFQHNGFGNQPFGQSSFGQGGFGQSSFGSGGFGQSSFGAGGFGQSPFGQNSYDQTSFQSNQFTQQSLTPATPVPSGLSDTSPDSFSTPEDREEAVQTLIAMGFEKSKAEKALRASFYNVETAIEYITSGNIPDVEKKPVVPTGIGANAPVGGPIIQGNQPSPSAVRQQRGGVGGGMGANIQQMRQLLHENPERLEMLKQTLQAEHPEIAQMIGENPQAFLDLLNQADTGDDAPAPGGIGGGAAAAGAGGQTGGGIKATLSPKEQEKISRLQEMGFERNRAIEAFLACDRNEELALNYLLSAFD